ncbi:MAG: hypothetical protein JWL81_2865 [Verrucomicrobiales bacterium]|nr:hypothetical protein [Verrucomicrobiales bacterium]
MLMLPPPHDFALLTVWRTKLARCECLAGQNQICHSNSAQIVRGRLGRRVAGFRSRSVAPVCVAAMTMEVKTDRCRFWRWGRGGGSRGPSRLVGSRSAVTAAAAAAAGGASVRWEEFAAGEFRDFTAGPGEKLLRRAHGVKILVIWKAARFFIPLSAGSC